MTWHNWAKSACPDPIGRSPASLSQTITACKQTTHTVILYITFTLIVVYLYLIWTNHPSLKYSVACVTRSRFHQILLELSRSLSSLRRGRPKKIVPAKITNVSLLHQKTVWNWQKEKEEIIFNKKTNNWDGKFGSYLCKGSVGFRLAGNAQL